MKRIKCLKCGLVNWSDDDATCKRCGANLDQIAQASPDISSMSEPSQDQKGPRLIYLQAVGAGVLISIGLFIYTLISWPKGPGEKLFLISGVIYAGFGAWFGSRRPQSEWRVALCISSFYILLLSYGLYRLSRYNQLYGGWFWTNKFYFSPIFLYASLPLAAFLGARFGSKPSLSRIAPLMCSFILTFIAIGYAHAATPKVRQMSYSFDMTNGQPDNLLMRVDIKFGLEIRDEPMSFRAYTSGGGGGWKLTVIRNSPTFLLDTQMTMNVDGKELKNTMWPVNQPDGSSRIDFSQKQDYSQIPNWRIGPNPDLFNALSNAHHIEIRWGNLNIVLPDEQVNSLRNFTRSWVQVLQEEDALCTNPQCTQPLPQH